MLGGHHSSVKALVHCRYSGAICWVGEFWGHSASLLLCVQVLVLELSEVPAEHAVSVANVDLLQDREGFTWKGHERLNPHTGLLPWPAGFQPRMLIQCLPPAAVTAVTLHAEWSLVAFGTSHGFGLFDYQRKSPVLARYVARGGQVGGHPEP